MEFHLSMVPPCGCASTTYDALAAVKLQMPLAAACTCDDLAGCPLVGVRSTHAYLLTSRAWHPGFYHLETLHRRPRASIEGNAVHTCSGTPVSPLHLLP
jgi:hypothetical protein